MEALREWLQFEPPWVVVAMVVDAFGAGTLEAIASGLADRGAASFVLVVGRDVSEYDQQRLAETAQGPRTLHGVARAIS